MTYYADQQPDRLELTQDNTLATWYQRDLPLWFNYWDGYGFQNIYGNKTKYGMPLLFY